MKKILRLLFLLLMIGSLFVDAIAQYIPIPEQNARWQVISSGVEWAPGFIGDWRGTREYINYNTNGYQIINGKKYVKVSKCGYGEYHMFLTLQFVNGVPANDAYFYFRNDSLNKKVYALIPSDTLTEFMLFDFNLQVGDSTILYSYDANILFQHKANVVAVDSILYKNKHHKRIHFLFEPYTRTLDSTIVYEGIGYLNGIFPPILDYFNTLDPHNSRLECYHSDSLNLMYFMERNDSCTSYACLVYHPLSIDDPSQIETILYPNPANNKVHISIEQNGNYEMSFYNLMGQKIHSQQIDHEAIIDVSAWVRGIYCYTISNQKGIAGKGKVILE